MTRRLIMLRHGQTEYNATRRMQGHLNTKLSPVGFEQAAAAAEFLTRKNIVKIVSSDLDRAFDTATVIGQRLNLPVEKDERLRETHLGLWQARSHEEVDQFYPGMRALWRHDATWAPPGGESRVEVARRARPVVTELMQSLTDWDSATVLLVAHGGVISALTSNLLELQVQQYPLFSGLGNTCGSQLTARPRWSAADGQKQSTLPMFDPATVADAQWYLDGWNIGVSA